MSSTINNYKWAYNQGLKANKARAKYNSEMHYAYSDDYVYFNSEVAAENAAFNLGYKGLGIDFENIVSGHRYGAIPFGGVSYNYREQVREMGLSLAALEGEEELATAAWFHDRPRVEVKGILLPCKGSDGEHLILPL